MHLTYMVKSKVYVVGGEPSVPLQIYNASLRVGPFLYWDSACFPYRYSVSPGDIYAHFPGGVQLTPLSHDRFLRSNCSLGEYLLLALVSRPIP